MPITLEIEMVQPKRTIGRPRSLTETDLARVLSLSKAGLGSRSITQELQKVGVPTTFGLGLVGGAGLGPCQELSPIMVKEIRKTVRALSVPRVTGATHTSRESNARG